MEALQDFAETDVLETAEGERVRLPRRIIKDCLDFFIPDWGGIYIQVQDIQGPYLLKLIYLRQMIQEVGVCVNY